MRARPVIYRLMVALHKTLHLRVLFTKALATITGIIMRAQTQNTFLDECGRTRFMIRSKPAGKPEHQLSYRCIFPDILKSVVPTSFVCFAT